MALQVMLALVVVFAIAVLVTAGRDRRWARSTRMKLSTVSARPELVRLHRRLLAERSAFGAHVMRYETALARASEVVGAGAGAVQVVPHDDPELERLRLAKDDARLALMDAQEAWLRVAPRTEPPSAPSEWVGSGLVRTTGLFFVGSEHVVLRIDHAHDANYWCIVESHRRRWGFGLGIERQQLTAVATDATPGRVLDLIETAVDDVDVALRPGFSPARAVRNLGTPRHQRAVRRQLHLSATVDDMHDGPTAEDQAVLRSLLRDWPDLHRDSATLRLSVSGPAMMIGLWRTNTPPELRLLATSGQDAWIE